MSVLYVFTGLCVLIALPFAWLRQRAVVRPFIVFWARAVFVLMGKRLKIHGKQNLHLHERYILLANHASLFDILAVMAVHPGVVWFGRAHLLKVPVFGRFLRMLDYIPMEAGDLKNTRQMLSQLTDKAHQGTIAIFPEGTRTLDGHLGRFKKGFIRVQRATQLGVLPVTLKGFYRLKPKNRNCLNLRAQLEVVVHPPVEADLLATMDDATMAQHMHEVIASAYH